MIRRGLLSLFFATAVFAQEIGSEIKQEPAQAPAESPPPSSTPVRPAAPAAAAQVSSGSAGKGSFGIRATFFGSPTSNLPTAAVGVAFFVTDLLKITFDAGAAASFPQYPQNTSYGFSVAAGLDLMFRSTTASVRPFATAQVGFGKLLTDRNDDFALVLNVGGGGEYFFSQSFSMNIRGMLAVPINLRAGTVGILFFTPGIGATVYF